MEMYVSGRMSQVRGTFLLLDKHFLHTLQKNTSLVNYYYYYLHSGLLTVNK